MSDKIQFLKLGGSLITDKNCPQTPRLDVLKSLAQEIAAAFQQDPGLRLVLGHGSGSFGHVSGKRYGTRQGVQTPAQWRGFAEVWRDAIALNRLVIDVLVEAGLPAISLPPCASVTAADGKVGAWDLYPMRAALEAGLLPVVFGDVVFDTARGGTILSTEDLFSHLAGQLAPARILLAGIEAGVWADFPQCTRLVDEICPGDFTQVAGALGGSAAVDVTGGMASKVRQSLELAGRVPGLQVLIFSGETPGNVLQALGGAHLGTLIHG